MHKHITPRGITAQTNFKLRLNGNNKIYRCKSNI